MPNILRIIVADFGWIHRGLGLIGNLTFAIGSVLFLPHFEAYKTIGVWLFIVGSTLMFVGALGEFLVRLPGLKRSDA